MTVLVYHPITSYMTWTARPGRLEQFRGGKNSISVPAVMCPCRASARVPCPHLIPCPHDRICAHVSVRIFLFMSASVPVSVSVSPRRSGRDACLLGAFLVLLSVGLARLSGGLAVA